MMSIKVRALNYIINIIKGIRLDFRPKFHFQLDPSAARVTEYGSWLMTLKIRGQVKTRFPEIKLDLAK